MALIPFQKPDNVLMVEASSTHGKFEFKPLEPGYGMTIGNALRRILLSSPEGFAINSIKIEGVDHEFATIPGVIEDVTQMILNLKKIRVKQTIEGQDEETVLIKIDGSTQDSFTGQDIDDQLSGFTVLNTDQHICTLDESATLEIQLTIDRGRGWIPAEEIQDSFADPRQIAIDAIYTPITNVRIQVDDTRVGQRTDYDRLTIEIDTDGTIEPAAALKDAARLLIEHLALFSDESIDIDLIEEQEEEVFDDEALAMRQLLQTKLDEIELSVRAVNCLRAAGVESLGDLVQHTEDELLKYRNFGKKSLAEVEELVEENGLTLGMDISMYNLD